MVTYSGLWIRGLKPDSLRKIFTIIFIWVIVVLLISVYNYLLVLLLFIVFFIGYSFAVWVDYNKLSYKEWQEKIRNAS